MDVTKTFLASVAAALLGVGAATATVPDAERSGIGGPALAVDRGIQLADNCGNWGPNQRNAEDTCRVRSWAPDPKWIRNGDPGSQDDSFTTGRGYSTGQDDEDEDEPFPCFC